jgi:hypothetical protein
MTAPPLRLVRPGYFDNGLGRDGWDPEDRCPLSADCALVREHGGGCDPRPEHARAKLLHQLLDAGLEGEALTRAWEYPPPAPTPATTGAGA